MGEGLEQSLSYRGEIVEKVKIPVYLVVIVLIKHRRREFTDSTAKAVEI